MASLSNVNAKRQLPPSALKVIAYMERKEKAITSKELIKEVGIAKRTLRYAIRVLCEEQLIVKEPVLSDMRKVRYTLAKDKILIEIRTKMV